MPEFSYKARRRSGELVEGILEVADRPAALAQIQRLGLFPIAVDTAKAGASFISPFIGWVDDIGEDGVGLIRDIRAIYDNYGFKTEILAASIRSVSHVRQAALAGADVATIPTDIFKKLMSHPLTDKGLAAFMADAKKANVTIKT